jgi:hypothetical protein
MYSNVILLRILAELGSVGKRAHPIFRNDDVRISRNRQQLGNFF